MNYHSFIYSLNPILAFMITYSALNHAGQYLRSVKVTGLGVARFSIPTLLFRIMPIIMSRGKFLMPNFNFCQESLIFFEYSPPAGRNEPLTCQSHDFMKSHSGAGGTVMKLRAESAGALHRNGGRLWSGYTELSLFP